MTAAESKLSERAKSRDVMRKSHLDICEKFCLMIFDIQFVSGDSNNQKILLFNFLLKERSVSFRHLSIQV